MKLRLLFLLVFLVSIPGIAQQTKTVTGTIMDANGVPLPGAEVKVTGKEIFDVTNFDGQFTLNNVVVGDVFRVTFLGFQAQEFTVSTANTFVINLQEDAGVLDEVVLIGYGTAKKRDLTGSIATVNAEEIEKTPTANIMQSLQGKVSGVQIVNAGSPGDSPTVRIRGVGTFGTATNVLYVVDGALYDNIDFLNTKDIKSLKIITKGVR